MDNKEQKKERRKTIALKYKVKAIGNNVGNCHMEMNKIKLMSNVAEVWNALDTQTCVII